jgi:hypothetical protein
VAAGRWGLGIWGICSKNSELTSCWVSLTECLHPSGLHGFHLFLVVGHGPHGSPRSFLWDSRGEWS